MKLDVGMYCRYKDFQDKIKIAKIKGIQKADEGFIYDYMIFDNDDGELETNIIKASFNIIDLIEVGDYVNGYPVNSISSVGKKIYEIEIKIPNNRKGVFIEKIRNNEDIKSIVTKDQFEQMSYEVSE